MTYKNIVGGDLLRYRKILWIPLILIVLLVSASYAYWQFNTIQKDLNVAGTNCFSLTYTDNTDAITIDNMVPTEDEEGLKEKGYSFTIKNTCNTIATYEVNLEDILASSDTKQLPNKYIKVSLNDSTPKVLNTYEEIKTTISNATNAFKLTSGSLKPDEKATYELKLWMDKDTPAVDEVMSATFESKVTVNTSYIEEENLANDMTILASSQNEAYSKEKEIFTLDMTSTNKNIIEYSYNNQNWTSVTPTKTLSLEKEYTKEGSYFIYVKDEVGNVKEYQITTDKLDQTAPERTIEPINNHETYLLKITMSDEKSGMDSYQIAESRETPTDWLTYTGLVEKEITQNGTYYIWSKDKLGNISYEAYSVNKIDKESPTIALSNTLTTWGASDTIHIHLTDDLIGLSGYQVTTLEEEPTNFIPIENTLETNIDYEVTENSTYYVYAKDAYNHISHEKIVIDKIDKKAPIINAITNSSNGAWTNKEVAITIDAIDNETAISKYQVKYSGNNNTWTDLTSNTDNWSVEQNETVYYRVIDIAGNISEEKSTDIKIDKTSPSKPAITNNKENTWTGSDLPITLKSTDDGSGIDHYEWYENGSWTTRDLTISDNIGSIIYTATRNETLRFRVIDKVGNISEESTTVVKIDKTKPTQSFSVASSTSGSNGWYKALSIKTSVGDTESGVSSAKYCITTGGSCTPSTNASLSSNTFTVALGTNSSAQRVCVNTIDKVGNIADIICSEEYKVDNDAPQANMTLTAGNGSITIDATNSLDKTSGIAKYEYSLDDTKYYSSTSPIYNFTNLESGNYIVYLKITDYGNNTFLISQNITITYVPEYTLAIRRCFLDDCDDNTRIFQKNYISNTTKIVFENNDNVPSKYISVYDESYFKNGKIKAYLVANENDTSTYTMIFHSKENIYLPSDSSRYFYNFSKLTKIEGLENLNTTRVTNMNSMFRDMSSLTSLNISNFDTSNVTNMLGMFSGMSSLTSLNISNFNTSNVINMSGMFNSMSSLTSLNISNFNTSNVADMQFMFYGMSSLTSLNISNFNTSNVTNMTSMFYGMSGLTSLNISNFNTSNVADMRYMFNGMSGLAGLNISNFNTSNVTNMYAMFSGMSSLTSLNISNFNTSNVTNMYAMFYGMSSLTSLNISNFNTSNVTDMRYMFNGMSSLTSLNISNFNTSNVTNMDSMFRGMSSLTSLNISNFDTSKVTTMYAMLYNDTKLTKITYGTKFVKKSGLNTDFMFGNCPANKPTDSSWNGTF